MGKLTVKGEVILDYLRRFPSSSRKAIARKAHRDFPELFTSVEAARGLVRYYTGSKGKLQRQQAENNHPGTIRDQSEPADPFSSLPEEVSFADTTPVVVTGEKVLVLADLHVPYYDRVAFEIAVNHGLQAGCDTCVLLGDVCDFFSISRFVEDPRDRDLAGELEATRQVIETICQLFPLVYYKLGNHEERWERYLFVRAPELVGIEAFEISDIFKLRELNIKVIDRMRHLKIGQLALVHGHEFGRTIWSPVNPARGLFLRAKASALCGHYHQTSEHVETTMSQRVIGCWSIGCLCQLKPRYSPYAKWNHGFAIIEATTEPTFAVSNHKVLSGRVC